MKLKRLLGVLLSLTLLLAYIPAVATMQQGTPTPEPTAAAEEGTTEVITETETITDTAGITDTEPVTSTDVITVTEDGVTWINYDDGVVAITGEVAYTNPFFTEGVAQPIVILEDQAGFVDRNKNFLMPLASQTLGQITSDFYTSPFNYSIALPIEPQGSYRDVDQDGEEENGVQVFAIAYWDNTFGDPFLEERDLGGGGWSTAYASTLVSENYETKNEIVGGKLLLYAPDDQQQFPAEWGEDGLLFTEDDSLVVTLPQGYTVVDLDTEPFTFDRSRYQQIDLIEPQGAAVVDYSDLTYTEAFTSFVNKLSKEYAFTEEKNIDWEALQEEFLPLMQQADEEGDADIYLRALRDFAWSIPDGHISGPFIVEDFATSTAEGLGLAMRDVDDGRVIVTFLLEDGPAAEAGLVLGAEIVAINGITTTDYVSNTIAQSAPFSTEHVERLQKLRYAVRFPEDSEVEIVYLNPGETEPVTVTLETVPERDSFAATSFFQGTTGFELPVEYTILDNGYAYVQITSFLDNKVLTIQLWERLMQHLNDYQIPGLIIDMRQNGGGYGFMADQMAAYFFDEPHTLGNTGYYDEDLDDFEFDPEDAERFYLPAEELRYSGDVVVLVGPACASACEFFSYDMTINDRATIVGHYPTAGLGGSVEDVYMPEGEVFRFTIGRAVDNEGNIHIEGQGVVPDVRVPVTPENLLTDEDVVLQTAVEVLDGSISVKPDDEEATDDEEPADDEEVEVTIIDGGTLALGDVVSGELETATRITYTLPVSEGVKFSVYVNSEEFDTYLRILDQEGNVLVENDDLTSKQTNSGVEEVQTPIDFVLVIEISAFGDDGAGQFELIIEEVE